MFFMSSALSKAMVPGGNIVVSSKKVDDSSSTSSGLTDQLCVFNWICLKRPGFVDGEYPTEHSWKHSDACSIERNMESEGNELPTFTLTPRFVR